MSSSIYQDLFNIEGKTVIVTGAAGQMGGEYVRTLLKAGAYVSGFDINPENPKGRLEEISSSRFMVHQTNITDSGSINQGLETVMNQFGTPQVLINNAGLDVPPGSSACDTGPFETYPEETWRKILEVNLQGVFLMCQKTGSCMAENGGGSIVNILSLYATRAPDHRIYRDRTGNESFFKPAAYGASKAAVANLTKYLAAYWAPKNVRVNALTLGGVENNQPKEFLQNYSEKVPMGRMAKQNEFNGAILFLSSDASAYMTGANLVIDGGYQCW